MWNKVRYRVQERRFSGTGTSTDEDVVFCFYQHLQYMCYFRCNGSISQKHLYSHRGFGKLSDRDDSPVQGNRRQYHVDTGAVRKTGIHDRIRLIDLTSSLTYDLLNNILQLFFIVKGLIQFGKFTCFFNKDIFRSVDHNLCNIIIFDNTVQNTETTNGTVYPFHDIHAFLDRDVFRTKFFHDHLLNHRLQVLITHHVQIKSFIDFLFKLSDNL